MKLQIKQRILTSIFLFLLLILIFFDNNLLLITLTVFTIISSLEFIKLMNKIFKKSNFFRYLSNTIFISYIFIFSIFLHSLAVNYYTKSFLFLVLLICIFSDVGGFIFGKFFKGRKLTKISPNKTISGSIGSFIFSIICVLIFVYFGFLKISLSIFLFTLATSFLCQSGDIFISYLKRKAKVKDTGNLLPGHGGILDRIDGILFGVPFGIIIFYLLS